MTKKQLLKENSRLKRRLKNILLIADALINSGADDDDWFDKQQRTIDRYFKELNK